MPNQPLRIVPLGGLGEVGKNMMVLEYGRDIIVVDCGVLFPEEDMPGIDLVIPDISYLLQRQADVRAILITHGHEDHTGALPYVLSRLPVPVYAPRLAHGLISVKLKEHRNLRQADLQLVEPGSLLELGSFKAEFFPVCHSIPDAMGLAIETPVGLVVHTGDFKIDHTPVDGKPTDLARLGSYGSKGVLLLLSDSTYAELPGFTPSEQVVGDALDRAIGESSGRVLVATFASLISRVQQVIDATSNHGRKVGIVGRSMVENVKMALDMGYLYADPGVLLSLGEARQLPEDQVVLVTTGSQGEPTSALVRIANGTHRDIGVVPGDTVIISATPIPGNEAVISRTIDTLFRKGARVLYDRIALVHVHGHASQEELKLMLNLTRPRFFVPIHGAYHHLVAHAALARSMGLPESRVFIMEDGDVLELSSEEGRIVDNVPAGHVFVDGRNLITTASPILRERRSLSRQGVVFVVLARYKSTGEMARPPEVLSQGVLDLEESPHVLGKVSEAVARSFDESLVSGANWESAATLIKDAAGKAFHRETGRSPVIMPLTIEV